MRLPRYRSLAPRALVDAAAALSDGGPDIAVLAGGTDLIPNMKRRQQTPATVVGLRGIGSLRQRTGYAASGFVIGALTRLSEIENDRAIGAAWPALSHAAASIATPPIRNLGTIGGNLCLDTRCSYYDQSAEWRASIDHCLKKDGEVCWVAPGSATSPGPAVSFTGRTIRGGAVAACRSRADFRHGIGTEM